MYAYNEHLWKTKVGSLTLTPTNTNTTTTKINESGVPPWSV